jgi:sortase A
MIVLPSIRLVDLCKAAAVAAIISGVVCVAEAGWIHCKAAVAQVLIGAAWRREQAGSRSPQPWPWADTRPSARLTFGEGANTRQFIVLEGSSGRNLAFGPAHDPASVKPGEVGNSVIEGHRDTHFAVLRDVNVGDTLHIESVSNGRASFVVTNIRVVDSRRERIGLHADRPRLTLVTCYPFDAVTPGGPLRLVVTADQSGPRDGT